MNIADLKQRWTSKIHGASVSKLKDPYGLIYEAAGNVLLKSDPKETIRIQQISGSLYSNVYDYVLPSDVKDDALIDLQPQTPRQPWDSTNETYQQRFDRFKSYNATIVKYNSGVRTLRVSKQLNPTTTVNAANVLTGNGTWTASGNATGLTTDTFNKIDPSASLLFNISASGSTATLSVTGQSPVDLSLLVSTGSLFAWVYIPNTTIITSFSLKWGSSSSNYYSATASVAQSNTGFVTGWNLIRFDWSGATTTGTPVPTSITYLALTFNYNGTAVSGCRINQITAAIGSIYNLVYYSKYLFQDATTGAWKEKPTADTDIINLDLTSYNLLQYETDMLIAQELQGKDGQFDRDFWDKKGSEVYSNYTALYKSERLRKREPYYRIVIRNHRRRR